MLGRTALPRLDIDKMGQLLERDTLILLRIR